MVIPRFWGIFLGRSEFLENVEYGRAGDFSLRMDARIPEGPGPFPAAIIVHGDGRRSLNLW